MDGLLAQFVTLLEDTRFSSPFYRFIPSRLGHHEAVDYAARAVAQAYHSGQFGKAWSSFLLPEAYTKAVNGLRNSLDASDNSLMVIMLLILFERIVCGEPKNVMAHLNGLTALLQSRSNTCQVSDVERALLFDNRTITLWIPLQTKSASPFENSRWLDFPAVACRSVLPDPISRLAELSYQLQIRLPRLVNHVRSLKGRQAYASVSDFALAKELMALQDIEAENKILHRIRIEGTKNAIDKVFVPCSLNFNSLEEFDAATGYWQGRVMVGKLCSTLSTIAQTTGSNIAFEASLVKLESQRIMANLFMSIQYAESGGVFVRRRYAQILPMCMATLPVLSEYRGLPISQVRSWLAEKISSAERCGKLTATLLSMTERAMHYYP